MDYKTIISVAEDAMSLEDYCAERDKHYAENPEKRDEESLSRFKAGTANLRNTLLEQQQSLRVLVAVDSPRAFTKEDLWEAWWISACKVISFSGINKEYESRCFEEYYERKTAKE